MKIKSPEAVLDKLEDNKCFHINTGTTAYYILEEPHTEVISGHEVEIAGGCVISKLDKKYIKDIDMINFEVDYSMEDEEY